MQKKLAVIVDMDEDFVTPLVYKLLEEWGEQLEIQVISQVKFYQEYFSHPRNIYILIINEQFYSDNIRKQACMYVFLLKERESDCEYRNDSCHVLFKYSSIKELYGRIMSVVRISDPLPVDHTKLYAVCSPVGGSGKTSCALGICEALANLGRKILYISGEDLQNFHYLLNADIYANPEFGLKIARRDWNIQKDLLREIEKAHFDFLRPLEKAPIAYQITEQSYGDLVRQLQNFKLYDAIVLEAPRDMNINCIHYLSRADQVLVIGMQDAYSAFKLKTFFNNIICSSEKFFLICNRFRTDRKNFLETGLQIPVCEYIEETEESFTTEYISRYGILRTTAYMLE